LWRVVELKKIDPAVAAALTDAVRELELCSCAEVVLEVRSRSGSYTHAEAGWVAVDVAVAWLLGYSASRKSDSVRHLMTTKRERVAQARLVAASVFHERGVANTAGESGVLVYLSLLEKHIELLADRGVLAAVPALDWNRVAETARARHASVETLLDIVRELTPLLGHCLPVREGDVDELDNVPRFVTE
jgi:putative membrane protein